MTIHSDDDDADRTAEGEESELSPEELREKGYPMFPQFRISQGKVDRIAVWRTEAGGKTTLITSQACPIRTTWAEIRRICGGGTYTAKPQGPDNRFHGSSVETLAGRPKAIEQIEWPLTLTAGGGIAETEPPAGPAPPSTPSIDPELMLDRRTREEREWQAKLEREKREWEDTLARRAAREAEEARMRQEEHALRMATLQAEFQAKIETAKSSSAVELKRIEVDAELRKAQLKAESETRGQLNTVDRIANFVEKAGEKLLEKHPEKIAKVFAEASGSKLEENARHAIKEQVSVLREEVAGEIVDAALEKASKDERVYQSLAKEILANPQKAKEFLELLKDVSREA